MSDRWNEALEAAAKACRNEKFLAVSLIGEQYNDACDDCAKAILALREAEDQRGAAATCTEGAIHVAIEGQMRESYVKPKAQSAPHPDIVLVPREILNSAVVMLEAEGDEHGVARFLRAAMRASAEEARRG